MAKQGDINLEVQKIANINPQPPEPHGERLQTDISDKFDHDRVAEAEMSRKKVETHHLEGSSSDPHGTPQYYEHLLKLALTSSQLDSHVLAFDFLHRLVLLDHQINLVEHFRNCVLKSKITSSEISGIRDSLHAYTRANVDYMFWRDKKQIYLDTNVHNAASQTTSLKHKSDANLPDLYKLLIPEIKEFQDLNAEISSYIRYCCLGEGTDQGLQQVTGSTGHRQSDTVQVLNHFAMAFVGGLSLIVPVLIMALHRSRVTSLVVTSVAVTLFSIVLAIWPLVSRHFPWMKGRADADEVLESKDVLTATAAYAAVLVVFVGTSLATVE